MVCKSPSIPCQYSLQTNSERVLLTPAYLVVTAVYVATIPQAVLAWKLPEDKAAAILISYFFFSLFEVLLFANGL